MITFCFVSVLHSITTFLDCAIKVLHWKCKSKTRKMYQKHNNKYAEKCPVTSLLRKWWRWVIPLSRRHMSLYECLHHKGNGERQQQGNDASVVPRVHCKKQQIHAANATHSIRGSKTLGRHSHTTAPQERYRLLSNGRFSWFVSFQLWNEQLQRGIRTNFKQGQIKVHSPKLPPTPRRSVFHSHNSSFFTLF